MYKIIGADQKEYGPITADQIRQWIRDGRVNAHTQTRLESGGDWQPLSAFPEFADAFQPGVATPPAPTIAPLSGGGSREAALQAIKGPAICLIVTGALGAVFALFGAVSNLLGAGMHTMPPNIPPQWQSFVHAMQGSIGGIINLFFAAMDGLVLFGAIKMMRLESRSLAIAACIVAMLPVTVSCCCVLGLPFGIWALVVMNKPEVKSHFT